MAYPIHIACAYVLKIFLTLIINGNNCLYYDIIIYKLNLLIDVVKSKISILKLFLPFY